MVQYRPLRNWRENQVLARRLKNAKLRTNACVEEIDYRGAPGLGHEQIGDPTLADGILRDWFSTPIGLELRGESMHKHRKNGG